MTEQKWFNLLHYEVFEVYPNNQWLFVHYHFSYSAAQYKFSINYCFLPNCWLCFPFFNPLLCRTFSFRTVCLSFCVEICSCCTAFPITVHPAFNGILNYLQCCPLVIQHIMCLKMHYNFR